MGHGSGAADQSACRVLPVIDEESDESENEISECAAEAPDTETATATARKKKAGVNAVGERTKEIVARMRELLRRAVAQSKPSPSSSTVAKKWKRAVSFKSSSGDHHHQRRPVSVHGGDGGVIGSPSPSVYSSLRVRDSAASFPSPARSPPPPCSASPEAQLSRQMQQQQQAHWITTDSDFVVLEL